MHETKCFSTPICVWSCCFFLFPHANWVLSSAGSWFCRWIHVILMHSPLLTTWKLVENLCVRGGRLTALHIRDPGMEGPGGGGAGRDVPCLNCKAALVKTWHSSSPSSPVTWSKITPSSVNKIVLGTFWLRQRERQPDLPQRGNCSAKEPYRDSSAQPNTQLHLHFALCGTCAHELENTLLHLVPSGKHFAETLCLFLSPPPPKMPVALITLRGNLWFLLWSLKHLASIQSRLICIQFTAYK